MAGWFDEDSISASYITTVYRTPDQGVSAKSLSNVSFNDYRKMTTSRGGSYSTGNGVVVPSGTVISAEDFHNAGGVTPTQTTFSTGSTKGASTTTVNGVFDSITKSFISSGVNTTAQGYFGLGATGGSNGAVVRNISGLTVGNVAAASNNGSVYMSGAGSSFVSGGFGGTLWFALRRVGYQTGTPGDTEWTTIRVRTLYPGGSTTAGNITVYNVTVTFNRSDGWTSATSGTTRIWSASYGSFGSPVYSNSGGWVGIYPCIIELD